MCGIAHSRRVVAGKGFLKYLGWDANEGCQLRNCVRLVRRYFRTDCTLVAVDVVELCIEDGIGDAPGCREVNGAGEDLPRLVHQAGALVKKALTRGIHD